MRKCLSVTVLAAALAACGGKSAGPTTPTAKGAPTDADHDHDDAVDEAAHHDDTAGPATPTDTSPEAAAHRAELLAAENAAYEQARPVFEEFCAGCHTQGGARATGKKLGHFDMTSYPFAGHHAGEAGPKIREVLGIGGGKPTMPDDHPGAVRGDELAKIAAWAEAWDAAQAAGAHAAAAPMAMPTSGD
ncbi:MAG TPA: hypothetical protein VHE35_19365 [Kofleriaceae bacterium]|nr:hypothetical protein [Kofleriaceae bacterium]